MDFCQEKYQERISQIAELFSAESKMVIENDIKTVHYLSLNVYDTQKEYESVLPSQFLFPTDVSIDDPFIRQIIDTFQGQPQQQQQPRMPQSKQPTQVKYRIKSHPNSYRLSTQQQQQKYKTIDPNSLSYLGYKLYNECDLPFRRLYMISQGTDTVEQAVEQTSIGSMPTERRPPRKRGSAEISLSISELVENIILFLKSSSNSIKDRRDLLFYMILFAHSIYIQNLDFGQVEYILQILKNILPHLGIHFSSLINTINDVKDLLKLFFPRINAEGGLIHQYMGTTNELEILFYTHLLSFSIRNDDINIMIPLENIAKLEEMNDTLKHSYRGYIYISNIYCKTIPFNAEKAVTSQDIISTIEIASAAYKERFITSSENFSISTHYSEFLLFFYDKLYVQYIKKKARFYCSIIESLIITRQAMTTPAMTPPSMTHQPMTTQSLIGMFPPNLISFIFNLIILDILRDMTQTTENLYLLFVFIKYFESLIYNGSIYSDDVEKFAIFYHCYIKPCINEFYAQFPFKRNQFISFRHDGTSSSPSATRSIRLHNQIINP